MSDFWIRPTGNKVWPLPERDRGRHKFAEFDHNGFMVDAHEVVPADAVKAPS